MEWDNDEWLTQLTVAEIATVTDLCRQGLTVTRDATEGEGYRSVSWTFEPTKPDQPLDTKAILPTPDPGLLSRLK